MNPNYQQGNMPPPQPYQQYPVPPMPIPPSANSQKPPHRWRLVIALIIFILLFIAALMFGIWAFAERQDYKYNSDLKANKAVELAKQEESTRKDNEFQQKEKNPLKTYVGPEAYGSVQISYPKTWSAYVIQADRTSTPLDAYFHPNFVPGLDQTGLAYALRVQITNQTYEQEMKQFESQVKAGKMTATPYAPKNVPAATGARLDGETTTSKKVSIVLLPLRDKTLKISTEAQEFVNDFNEIILANLKFIP